MAWWSTKKRSENEKDDSEVNKIPSERHWIVAVLLNILAAILFPVSLGLVRTIHSFYALPSKSTILGIQTEIALFAIGVIAYCIVFICFFKTPATKLYIWGHEFTHAIMGFINGSRIKKFRVEQSQGSVTLTRTGIFTLLSPYFFPLYMTLILAIFGVVSLFSPSVVIIDRCFVTLIGIAWGFHFCFTLNALLQWQSDIESCGFFFSYSFILFLNLVVLCIVFVAISPITTTIAWKISTYMIKNTFLWLNDNFYSLL